MLLGPRVGRHDCRPDVTAFRRRPAIEVLERRDLLTAGMTPDADAALPHASSKAVASEISATQAHASFVSGTPPCGLGDDCDVDGDGMGTPRDALILINWLNECFGEQCELPEFMDVNCDGQISPVDVLLVINCLNRKWAQGATAEGEAAVLDSSWLEANAADQLAQASDARVGGSAGSFPSLLMAEDLFGSPLVADAAEHESRGDLPLDAAEPVFAAPDRPSPHSASDSARASRDDAERSSLYVIDEVFADDALTNFALFDTEPLIRGRSRS